MWPSLSYRSHEQGICTDKHIRLSTHHLILWPKFHWLFQDNFDGHYISNLFSLVHSLPTPLCIQDDGYRPSCGGPQHSAEAAQLFHHSLSARGNFRSLAIQESPTATGQHCQCILSRARPGLKLGLAPAHIHCNLPSQTTGPL